MPNDNTLGAPTEGLGQTVTFTAGGSGGVPTMNTADRQGLRLGQSGRVTSTGQAQQVAPATPDPTVAALMRMGGKLLEPAIKAEQTTQFMQGMQRAAQGEAVKEIVDEQPWYSKVFGPTSLVDGARAYTAAAKATAIATDLDARMEDIAKLPGDAFAKHLTDRLAASATGDSATDAVVQQQFMAQMPEIMKRQARSHYLYQQGAMIDANRAYVGTAFKALATAETASRKAPEDGAGGMPRAVTDDGDLMVQQVNALNAMQTPAGMDPKVHKKVLAAEVVQSVNDGSFAVANVLEASGAMGEFEPEQASQIRAAVNAKRSQVRAELPASFGSLIASVTNKVKPGATEPEILGAVEELNKAYAKLTGDNKPYITAQGSSSLLVQLQRENDAAYEKATRAAAKATDAYTKENEELAAINSVKSAIIQGTSVNGAKAETERDAWASLEATHKDVFALRARMVSVAPDKNYGERLQGSIARALQTDSGAGLYEILKSDWLPMIASSKGLGKAPALHYAGEYGGRIERFADFLKHKPNPTQQDIDFAFSASASPPPREPTSRDKLLAKELEAGWLDKAWNAVSADSFAVKNPTGLAAMLAPHIPNDQPINSDTKTAAITKARGEISVLAGYHWRVPNGSKSMESYLSESRLIGDDRLNIATDLAINQVTKRAGFDSVTSVVQVPSVNGVPQLMILGKLNNGDETFQLLTGADITKAWESREAVAAQQAATPTPDSRSVTKAKSPEQVARERKAAVLNK